MEQEIIKSSTTDKEEVSLKDLSLRINHLYKYLLSRWLTICMFGVLGAIVGFGYAAFKKPLFTATTTFVLEEDKSGGGMGSLAGLASMAGVDIGGSGGGGMFQGDNILELYKSRTMIQKTLLTEINYNGKRELLINRYIDFNELRERWDKKPKLKNIKFEVSKTTGELLDPSRLKDSVIGKIVTDINKNYMVVAKPDKKLSIIKAEVKAPDEFFAKAFNDQIVKKVNEFYVQTKTKKAIENVAILQQNSDSVRAVMTGDIYSAAAVSDATPNLNPTRQIQRLAPVQKSQFSMEANKAILSELVKNLELSKMSLRKETPLIQVIDRPVFPLEIDRVGRLRGLLVGGVLLAVISIVFLTIGRIIKEIYL